MFHAARDHVMHVLACALSGKQVASSIVQHLNLLYCLKGSFQSQKMFDGKAGLVSLSASLI